jgi:hypothetical protein
LIGRLNYIRAQKVFGKKPSFASYFHLVIQSPFNRSARRINPDAVFGYIFNIPSTSFIPFLKNRHWVSFHLFLFTNVSVFQFSVIRRGKNYYNLDSKLPEPIIIDDFIVFANKHLAAGNQLLLVSKKEDADRCVNKEEE